MVKVYAIFICEEFYLIIVITEPYFGEAVTHLEHALQCAHLAEREGFGESVIVAALLHGFFFLFICILFSFYS